MKSEQLLRAILPNVLIDNFEVVNFEKPISVLTSDLMRRESPVEIRQVE